MTEALKDCARKQKELTQLIKSIVRLEFPLHARVVWQDLTLRTVRGRVVAHIGDWVRPGLIRVRSDISGKYLRCDALSEVRPLSLCPETLDNDAEIETGKFHHAEGDLQYLQKRSMEGPAEPSATERRTRDLVRMNADFNKKARAKDAARARKPKTL